MKHRHRPQTTRIKCFAGPVKWPENQAAHGDTCIIDTCACGARRCTNVNGVHVERGPWVPCSDSDSLDVDETPSEGAHQMARRLME